MADNPTVSSASSASAEAAARHQLSVALVWWMGAAVLACCVAASAGAERAAAAGAAAFALAPAVATLIMLPRWGETWAQVLSIFSWLGFVSVAAALSGGPSSPTLAAFLLAPAVALWSGKRDRVVEASFFSLIAFMAAAAGSAFAAQTPVDQALGPLPSFLGVFGVAFAGGLMAACPAPFAARLGAVNALEGAAAPAQATAELSHELRTPLTHIIGFAEMMERQVFGPLNDRYREYAGVIRTSGTHLLGLVNAMLDLSRLEEGARRLEIERFDARDIAREVAASARPSADEKAVQLILECPETPLMSDADPRALRQILINIVSNGVKFTPTDGRARLALRADGRDLVLEMADSGPGIPPKERDLLGGRFIRGGSSVGVEGAGLGLAIVKRLAALHGGSLSFGDAPEGGALVRVRLPVLSPLP
ncbi:MAG: HAMP domain-containing histidine kinase [Alphaproteobacteria bacterium]|nr:HAMP domain-containing histidine kinase [Alphaproteobacteria bacterium]